MRCARCDCDPGEMGVLRAVCLDSIDPVTKLCLPCWAALQVWMRPLPDALLAALGHGPRDERPD